mmetsp:Transcript_47541/g.42631  ORF Transcript_47541/g.42631 Transcript_47541/m.42631 type:complete len:301 (-) Transcript_47541:267-1169(-)
MAQVLGDIFGHMVGALIVGTASAAVSQNSNQTQEEKMNALAGPDSSQIRPVQVICTCSQTLIQTPYESIYGCNYDKSCDKCLKWMGGQKYVYYCRNHDLIKKPAGFAICYACTNNLIQQNQSKQNEIAKLQQENTKLCQEIDTKLNQNDNVIICGQNINKSHNKNCANSGIDREIEGGDDNDNDNAPDLEQNSAFMANFKNGWMYKAGWYNTSWKKRYFELNGVLKTLTYYVESGNTKGAKYKMQGFIDFKKTKILRMMKSKTEDEFHVVTKEREWMFKCDTNKERDEWYYAILTLCAGK